MAQFIRLVTIASLQTMNVIGQLTSSMNFIGQLTNLINIISQLTILKNVIGQQLTNSMIVIGQLTNPMIVIGQLTSLFLKNITQRKSDKKENIPTNRCFVSKIITNILV